MAQFRFFAPVLPLVYVLAARGAFVVLDLARMSGPWPRDVRQPVQASLLLTAILMGLGIVVSTATLRVPALARVGVDDPISDARQLVKVGEWLARIAPPESTIAVGEAGAIPYVTNWRTLDMFGLTDRAIAKAPRVIDARGVLKKDPQFVIARILSWNPDFVEFYAMPGFDTVLGPNDNLLWTALMNSAYVPVPPYNKMNGVVIFARTDILSRLSIPIQSTESR